jgi:D-alanyl-lipoteichoic acid acyltransferase DltB (MBOAT superfamily)
MLAASALFYMAFKPGYIFLLIGTIAIDYFSALAMQRSSTQSLRKLFLVLSLSANLGILLFYKYLDFFIENLNTLLSWFSFPPDIPLLSIVLPIGLSFHTFQSMSYTIEVYKGNQPAERHFGILALYVLFFPQMVAGPIERPQNIITQLKIDHAFDYARTIIGLRWMLWGLFKKMVIADNLNLVIQPIFANPNDSSSLDWLLAAYGFAFQIYCDFSGYSDIAIGSALILGVTLMTNFNVPYSAKNIKEFWERWHISLSTWFRDYLYIPLGGNRVNRTRWLGNIFIVFTVSGFWHGASWNFIIWGAIHGLLLVIYHISAARLQTISIPFFGVLGQIITFHIVVLAWIFFRADSLETALVGIDSLIFSLPKDIFSIYDFPRLLPPFATIGALLIFHWLDSKKFSPGFQKIFLGSSILRWVIYMVLLWAIVLFGVTEETHFIYFQF